MSKRGRPRCWPSVSNMRHSSRCTWLLPAASLLPAAPLRLLSQHVQCTLASQHAGLARREPAGTGRRLTFFHHHPWFGAVLVSVYSPCSNSGRWKVHAACVLHVSMCMIARLSVHNLCWHARTQAGQLSIPTYAPTPLLLASHASSARPTSDRLSFACALAVTCTASCHDLPCLFPLARLSCMPVRMLLHSASSAAVLALPCLLCYACALR